MPVGCSRRPSRPGLEWFVVAGFQVFIEESFEGSSPGKVVADGQLICSSRPVLHSWGRIWAARG
jgi:hypothetical protein